MPKQPLHRLFIPNRGEICRRIAQSAKALGMETVTVWPAHERVPNFLEDCVDTIIRTSPETNIYLDMQQLLKIAKENKCDSIHPGFGFLSEQAEFAEAVQKSSIVWVGPNSASMRAMASKDSARDIAKKAGVPVNEALQGINPQDGQLDLDVVHDFANRVGFPLLVKAAYGGGGKGMRLVHKKEELEDAIVRGSSEAKSSFGNGLVLVEKYISSPRHVEVQILGDQHGNVYALGDRDCSVQRRHQKIIEEAPAPNMKESTRKAMHDAAILLAKNVSYDSAGTVEFLVDANSGDFCFLEMNTRLQVEHPVTEEVFGLDLVALQLKIAAGEALPDFSTLTPRGHAIEVRIYAEDCLNGFLPAPGPIHFFRPDPSLGIRWEVGIDDQDEVTATYDPMISKCVATGTDREEAINRLIYALRKSPILGTTVNSQYLVGCLGHPSFRAGGVTTHFLDKFHEEIAASLEEQANPAEDCSHFATLRLLLNDRSGGSNSVHDVTTQAFSRKEGSQNRPLEVKSLQSQKILMPKGVLFRGRMNNLYFSHEIKDREEVSWIWIDGRAIHDKLVHESLSGFLDDQANEGTTVAPVPGKVITVKVQAGDQVKSGDVILVLESMKMEFEIKADQDRRVMDVLAKTGDQVNAGDNMVTWDVD